MAARKPKTKKPKDLRDYDLIVRTFPVQIVTQEYSENLEQPYPYQHVETRTTYGVLAELK